MNFKNKKFLSGIVAVVILGGMWYWWHNYGPYDITTPEKEIGGPKEYERFMNSLKQAYENDIVGFATPEETFNAFREALKAGDYELAASYFVPEKQEEMLKAFKIAKQNGFIDKQVGFLFLNNKLLYSDNKERAILQVKTVEGYEFQYELRLNIYNNIWKMYEL